MMPGGSLLFYLLGYNIHNVLKVNLRVYSSIKLYMLYSVESVGAAIIKYHRLSGLNSKNLFPHSSGAWKSKFKMPTRSVSSTALSFGCRWPHSHCVLAWSERKSEPMTSLLTGMLILLDQCPNLLSPFKLNCITKALSLIQSLCG